MLMKIGREVEDDANDKNYSSNLMQFNPVKFRFRLS